MAAILGGVLLGGSKKPTAFCCLSTSKPSCEDWFRLCIQSGDIDMSVKVTFILVFVRCPEVSYA